MGHWLACSKILYEVCVKMNNLIQGMSANKYDKISFHLRGKVVFMNEKCRIFSQVCICIC